MIPARDVHVDKEEPRAVGILALSGWRPFVSVIVLFLANELIPAVFGTGKQAIWDWSFLFVTLRFIVVPCLALLHFGANLSSAVRQRRLSLAIVVRCLGTAALIWLCWFQFEWIFLDWTQSP